MNKKIIYLIIAIALIIIAICMEQVIINRRQVSTTNSNDIIQDNISEEVQKETTNTENTIENVIEDSDNSENKEEDIEHEENITSEVVDTETVKKQETDREKAINLVKKKWGEDNKVYFVIDRVVSDEEYIVCVRNKSTTEALCWYKVDLKNETVEVE